jgi:hypothetical protein
MIELPSRQREDRVCFQADKAFNFPHDPMGSIVAPWEGCVDSADPVGNALKGARTCSARRTPVNITYAGRHDDRSFTFEGTVAQGSDEAASVSHLGSGDFRITGKRVGDCY